MALYLFDSFARLTGDDRFDGGVAQTDVARTLRDVGAKTVHFRYWYVPLPKLRGLFLRLFEMAQMLYWLYRVKARDEVFFQYPYWKGYYLPFLVHQLTHRKARVTFLVHDLNFIRCPEQRPIQAQQLRLLNSAHRLLVHTPQMKELLQQLGLTVHMDTLTLFDYYADDAYRTVQEQIAERHIIAFAGNLTKSAFLRRLDASTIPHGMLFRFYGVCADMHFHNSQISYRGKFLPQHTATLQAGWGLVWDGDSLDTCSGAFGQYLRINCPHKLCLYLAAGIPVVVWRQSAHARFVETHGVGITANSIAHAYTAIAQITDEQYRVMVKKARAIGDQLRRGAYLKALITH